MRMLMLRSLQERSHSNVQVSMRESLLRVEFIEMDGEKVGTGRCMASVLHGKRIRSSGYKECKRVHPNMVLVHD
jgi:hypothetical protein